MRGLKEKAKTLQEIEDDLWLNTDPKQKWVRLEDAEQAIAELKQKLLELLNEYPSNDGIDIPYDDEIRVTRLIQWKQKLERFINGL